MLDQKLQLRRALHKTRSHPCNALILHAMYKCAIECNLPLAKTTPLQNTNCRSNRSWPFRNIAFLRGDVWWDPRGQTVRSLTFAGYPRIDVDTTDLKPLQATEVVLSDIASIMSAQAASHGLQYHARSIAAQIGEKGASCWLAGTTVVGEENEASLIQPPHNME